MVKYGLLLERRARVAHNKNWFKIITLFSILALGFHLIHLYAVWSDIPDRIAIHFTSGEPNNWGSKYFLLFMPIVGLLIWWLLGRISKHPEKLNYINLTEKNRDRQYKMTGNIMVIIQNLSLFSVIFANEAFLKSAISTDDNLFFILSIVSLALLLIVTLYNVIWAIRLNY